MSISQRDIKLLWGKSGNRCAICKEKLSSSTDSTNILIGEQAHIVAQSKDGPRGNSNLTLEERDSYSNLILLCSNHHSTIDQDTSAYTIEKLHKIKSDHELYVEESLSSTINIKLEAEDLAYTDIIDTIVELMDLNNFESWHSFSLSNGHAMLSKTLADNSFKLYLKLEKIIFTDTYDDLNASISYTIKYFFLFCNLFSKHANLNFIDDSEDMLLENKFYNIDSWDEIRYNELLSEYYDWKKLLWDISLEFVKSLNWFSNLVREKINPKFFITQGKFLFVEFDGFSAYPIKSEYTYEEISNVENRYNELVNQANKF